MTVLTCVLNFEAFLIFLRWQPQDNFTVWHYQLDMRSRNQCLIVHGALCHVQHRQLILLSVNEG